MLRGRSGVIMSKNDEKYKNIEDIQHLKQLCNSESESFERNWEYMESYYHHLDSQNLEMIPINCRILENGYEDIQLPFNILDSDTFILEGNDDEIFVIVPLLYNYDYGPETDAEGEAELGMYSYVDYEDPCIEEYKSVSLIKVDYESLSKLELFLKNKKKLYIYDVVPYENYADGWPNIRFMGQFSLCDVPFRDDNIKNSWILPVINMDENSSYEYLKPIDLSNKFKEDIYPLSEINIYEKNEVTVYVRVAKDIEEESDGSITLEVLTAKMLDYIDRYFKVNNNEEDWIDYIYTPYMCSIVIDTENESLKKELLNYQETFGEIKIGKYDGEKSKEGTIPATMIFAASPLKKDQIYIEGEGVINITGTDIERRIIDCENKAQEIINGREESEEGLVECKFKTIIEKYKSYKERKVDIYCVGNANMIVCRNSSFQFIYDFGIPIEKDLSKSKVKQNYYDIINTNDYSGVKYIIISHLHGDHFNGLFLLNDIFWEKPHFFIMPYEYNYLDINSKRLLAYLIKKKQVIFVSGRDECLFVDGEYKVFVGTGIGKTRNEIINNSSIIIQLKDTLLTADCSCLAWPDEYGKVDGKYQEFKYIVGPHHFGVNSICDENQNSIITNVVNDDTKIYFCVGENTHHHPEKDQLKYLWDITNNIELTNKYLIEDSTTNSCKAGSEIVRRPLKIITLDES